MITVGLTGGIASGKSTVSAMLRELGAHIVDADRVGHEAYLPGTKVWDEVVAAFGRDIVADDGSIDRRKLGPIVFADPAKLTLLNSILHPRMRETMEAMLEEQRRAGTPVVIMEAAILIEAGWQSLVDEVWVTAVPETVAAERLISRSGLTREQAEARIRSQLSNEERQKQADHIIDTNCTLDEVRERVEQAWADVSARALLPDPAR